MTHLDTAPLIAKKPWLLTFFGLLAAVGLAAMPFLAGPPSDKMPDIVRFIGHFHPVLLHLPIGVFSLILIQELGSMFFKQGDQGSSRSLFPLFFGAASAIVAVLAGFLLYHGHGDEYGSNPIAERHLWGGLIFAVAAISTFILKAWTVALNGNFAFYRLLLFGSVGVMGFTSHDGASMTHGSDYLTIYAPEPIRKVMGLPTKKAEDAKPKEEKDAKTLAAAPADPVVYANIVAPILERRCVQCHKESKSKGKFRMDTYELLVKGGKEGSGLEPGKSADSNIITRIELPKDDEEHMPPEGKADIEAPEVTVVKWWIDSGADPKKTLSEFILPAPVKEAIAKLQPAADATAAADPAHAKLPAAAVKSGPDPTLKAAVSALAKDFPGALSFESQASSNLVFTAVSLRGTLDDAGFGKLKPVMKNLVSVDLSATKITDQAVAQLVTAQNLQLIRLAETGVTDAVFTSLVKLPALESINLYGTRVTDAGIGSLAELPRLKHLYLWKTAVTPAAIQSLKAKLPACDIITGMQP